jgi:hypothetical protein
MYLTRKGAVVTFSGRRLTIEMLETDSSLTFTMPGSVVRIRRAISDWMPYWNVYVSEHLYRCVRHYIPRNVHVHVIRTTDDPKAYLTGLMM